MAMFELTIILAALIIATYTDLKVREVPDWLNFSLVALGFGIAIIKAISFFSLTPIYSSVAGFGLAFVISVVMFYTGQWGGGDAKMLMGIGAVIGASFSLSDFFVAFVFNLIAAGAVYGLIWGFSMGALHRKKIGAEMGKIFALKKIALYRKLTIIMTALFVAAIFFIPYPELKITLTILTLLFFSTFYLWVFVKAIENVCMIKKVNPKSLTEGDWIIEDVKVGKKVLASKKDLGVSKKQIALLIKKKVKFVTIKKGIPFIPSFLISFFLTVYYGNIFLILLT